MTTEGTPVTTRNYTVYGRGILSDEVKAIGDYLVITDEIPWRLFRHEFPREPLQVIMPGTLEQTELDRMAARLAPAASIVGLGGGSVIDAAKYFAYLRDQTPLLVPTITSSNAQFSDFISVRHGGGPFGFRKNSLPRRIVVDLELISRADRRLNRAGYADVLCLQTTLNDWRLAAVDGRRMAVDSTVEGAIEALIDSALAFGDEIGRCSILGIELLMKLLEESAELIMAHPRLPISAGSEHLFAWQLERVCDRQLIHGETVAMGLLIASRLQGRDQRRLSQGLARARVRRHPDEVGVSWAEIRTCLLSVVEYNREVRGFATVFDGVAWGPELLEEIRELLYGQERGAD
jgi:glycerol-1-phosphate dehydrogenase [NAD(P)+]